MPAITILWAPRAILIRFKLKDCQPSQFAHLLPLEKESRGIWHEFSHSGAISKFEPFGVEEIPFATPSQAARPNVLMFLVSAAPRRAASGGLFIEKDALVICSEPTFYYFLSTTASYHFINNGKFALYTCWSIMMTRNWAFEINRGNKGSNRNQMVFLVQ